MIDFSQEEIFRYPRHFSVGAIGIAGQKKIKSARVLLIGTGGIGSPAALYLAASGVGQIGLIDHDIIEISNLQRQILFRTQDLGKLKVDAAKEQLNQLNPFSQIHTYPYPLSPQNASELFEKYDYILDGSDNYLTRYLVNHASQKTQKILISASVFQFGGQVACFKPSDGPCYECLYPSPPPDELIPNCAQAGVLGVIPGILALLAVNQIFIHILGLHSSSFFGRIHEFNGLDFSMRSYDIPTNLECQSCQTKKSKDFTPSYQHFNFNQKDFCKMPSPTPHNAHEESTLSAETTAQQLDALIKSKALVQLIDVRESWERDIAQISPSIHIPLGDLASKAQIPSLLNPEALTITYCQAGIRSAKAVKILKQQGFKYISNLSGGIESWLTYKNKTT